MKTQLFIAVDPVGSGFAMVLQTSLKTDGVRVLRCSYRKGVDHQARRRKVFFVTQHTLNKVEQFNAFTRSKVSCPAYALTPDQAKGIGARTLFARTLVNSTGGRGIVEFAGDSENYPTAPLYTEYIPKKAEYRVHVFNGEVIDVQQKKKKRGFDENSRDTRVRNLQNGYVYTRNDITPPTGLSELAINAVNAVGYRYGAVDIIYNEKRNQCFVLEVNSRPGLMGTTLSKYSQALKGML